MLKFNEKFVSTIFPLKFEIVVEFRKNKMTDYFLFFSVEFVDSLEYGNCKFK